MHRLTAILKAGLARLGFAVPTGALLRHDHRRHRRATQRILARGVAAWQSIFRRVDARTLGLSLDETTTRADVVRIWRAFDVDAGTVDRGRAGRNGCGDALPAPLARTSPFLTHPVFNRYHSRDRDAALPAPARRPDLALDRSMIPLGSCTMKLNATSEMIPVTWPEFGDLHPFAPRRPGRGLSPS